MVQSSSTKYPFNPIRGHIYDTFMFIFAYTMSYDGFTRNETFDQ